jgi:hypothetical protein
MAGTCPAFALSPILRKIMVFDRTLSIQFYNRMQIHADFKDFQDKKSAKIVLIPEIRVLFWKFAIIVPE